MGDSQNHGKRRIFCISYFLICNIVIDVHLWWICISSTQVRTQRVSFTSDNFDNNLRGWSSSTSNSIGSSFWYRTSGDWSYILRVKDVRYPDCFIPRSLAEKTCYKPCKHRNLINDPKSPVFGHQGFSLPKCLHSLSSYKRISLKRYLGQRFLSK